jgi:4-hydroxy-tetrahydrodipicolinate synthase
MPPKPRFGSVITAMVTPFASDLSIDFDQVDVLVNHLADHGSQGIVVCGTTGESATLSDEEKVALYARVKKAVGNRVKVIAGTGCNDTAATVTLTRQAEAAGVDGALLVAPYYNKPPQEGLYQHFGTVAKATSLPIMVYNVPGRTAINISASTVCRLSADFENIVAVKEASKDMEQIAEIAAGTKNFEIYSGDDGTTLPIMALGGVGVVSVTSHVAGDEIALMTAKFAQGDLDGARCLHLKSLPLTQALFAFTSPIPVKTALEELGILKTAYFRLPLVQATPDQKTVLRAKLGLAPR